MRYFDPFHGRLVLGMFLCCLLIVVPLGQGQWQCGEISGIHGYTSTCGGSQPCDRPGAGPDDRCGYNTCACFIN